MTYLYLFHHHVLLRITGLAGNPVGLNTASGDQWGNNCLVGNTTRLGNFRPFWQWLIHADTFYSTYMERIHELCMKIPHWKKHMLPSPVLWLHLPRASLHVPCRFLSRTVLHVCQPRIWTFFWWMDNENEETWQKVIQKMPKWIKWKHLNKTLGIWRLKLLAVLATWICTPNVRGL